MHFFNIYDVIHFKHQKTKQITSKLNLSSAKYLTWPHRTLRSERSEHTIGQSVSIGVAN
jgi:hypothetical protein